MKKLTMFTLCFTALCNIANAQWTISGNSLQSATGTSYIENLANDNFEFTINGNTVGRWTSSDLTVFGDLHNSGNSDVTGNQNINMNQNINGNQNVNGNANFNMFANFNDNISVNRDINANNDVNVNHSVTIQHDLSVNLGTVGIGTPPPLSTYVIDINGAGRITSGTWAVSDARYKKNVQPLINVQDKLFSVAPMSYDFRKDEFKELRFDDKKHFGFIAQELEKVYPNLVQQDDKGFYAVNYTEFIPLLLQALKEQNSKVQTLESRIADLEKAAAGSTGINDAIKHNANTLEQNIPNPFNGSTVIKFNIGNAFQKAFIGVYDMNGKQVRQVNITAGMSQVSFEKDLLSAGMYMYSLVVDNNLVDTKKMIVSE